MALAFGLGLASCGEKAKEVEKAFTEGLDPLPNVATAGQPQAMAKFGFAAHLPKETEGYIGTLQLKKHFEALKESNWAKEVNAFLDDKTPAPSAGKTDTAPPASNLLSHLWGQDGFFAFGAGAAKALKPWQTLLSYQTELQYLSLMQGTAAGSPGESKQQAMISQLIDNVELLKQAAAALEPVTLPPMFLGIQTDKPDEVLQQILPPAFLEQAKQKAKVSQMTSAGGKFTIVEGTFSAVFDDEMKNALLASVPADKEEAKGIISAAMDGLQKKSFCLAYGAAHGHLIVALGAQRPNLDFGVQASNSLMALPELSFLSTFADKNLLAVSYFDGAVLEALRNPEPLQPMVRGVMAGLRTSPLFGPMVAALEPKVKDLGSLEKEVHSRSLTTVVGAAWWDKGLRLEFKGGLSPEGLEAKKPLRFGPLLDDASVVFGLTHHGDPARNAKIRALVEAWVEVLYAASQELVKAGMGGKDGAEIAKWLQTQVVPPLVGFYQGSKDLYLQSTGNEHAWIVDLGGKVPPLPLLPQKPGEAPPKMLRFAMLDDVVNRPAIGQNWSLMEQSLNQLLGAFPQLNMSQMPPPDIGNAPGGLTTFSYPLLPESDDLTPSASVSDSTLIVGTSKPQQADLGTRLLRAKPVLEPTTLRWRLSFGALREAAANLAAGTAAESLQPTLKWLSPLGDASGRLWIEAGNVRQSITLQAKDTVRYD